MKRRSWQIFGAFLLVAILWAIWCIRTQKHGAQSGQPASAVQNSQAQETTVHSGAGPNGAGDSFPDPPTNVLVAADKSLRLKLAVEQKNVPVNFFGRVVDQDGLPLPGVTVGLRVRQWYLTSSSTQDARFLDRVRTTGPDGTFGLEGEYGDDLSVRSIEKQGYELSSRSLRGFSYHGPGSFRPDPSSRQTFKMWRMTAAEPLITGEKFYGIIPDGRVYTLDFVGGKKIEGITAQGDIRLAITRPDQVDLRNRFPWSFSIETINGGVIETQDEFMYVAPDSGYLEHYEETFDPLAADWKREVRRQFYLRSRGGQVFGRLEVEVLAYYNTKNNTKSVFSVKSFVNTAASRNLRFDPNIQPKPAFYE